MNSNNKSLGVLLIIKSDLAHAERRIAECGVLDEYFRNDCNRLMWRLQSKIDDCTKRGDKQ